VKVAVPVLIALAALVAGSALVRSRTREEECTAPRKGEVAAILPPKPLPVSSSSAGTQAVQLVRLYREQRDLRSKVPASGFSEAQVRRLRTLDQSLNEDGHSLSQSLRGNPEAWKDLIALLPALEEFDSSRDVVLRVRGAIDSESEALWISLLRTGAQVNDRRLALVALEGRSSRDVVLALVAGAKDDDDRRVRAEALGALAELRRRPLSEDLARMLTETLKSRSSADQDPVVRQIAAGLVMQMHQEAAPAPLSSRRTTFGQSSKSVENRNP
jgi:HEAT repeat protein